MSVWDRRGRIFYNVTLSSPVFQGTQSRRGRCTANQKGAMEVSLGKILSLLEAANPAEVRCAALTVLGELSARNAAVQEAVIAALTDEDGTVRLQAITTAGKLRVERALPVLAERIKAGGVEAEQAAAVAAGLGGKGSRTLRELMPRVAPGLRRYIARALAGAGAAGDADVSELEILLDRDPAVVGAAVQSLASAIPGLDGRRKQVVADALRELAGVRKTDLSPAGELGVVRLAGLLDDPRLAAMLWQRILPPSPTELRAAALSALGKWAESPNKQQRNRLFQCAADSDFRIAAPALMILAKLPVTERSRGEWLALLRGGSLAGRRLALARVGGHDSSEAAEALASQLEHPDRAYREEVLTQLVRTEHGRKQLAGRLVEAETADAAWPLARALAPLAATDPEAWADELFPRAVKYLETADRRADPLLYIMREGGAAGLRDRLEKKAATLVTKKAFEAARLLYRALTRDPAAGFPYRMRLAALGLKTSSKELSAGARTQDPCLGQFAELARSFGPEVLAELDKAAWLQAEDLYYLGFHFTESIEADLRSFGASVLQLLVRRFPRTKLAAWAKNKLGSAGLGSKKAKHG